MRFGQTHTHKTPTTQIPMQGISIRRILFYYCCTVAKADSRGSRCCRDIHWLMVECNFIGIVMTANRFHEQMYALCMFMVENSIMKLYPCVVTNVIWMANIIIWSWRNIYALYVDYVASMLLLFCCCVLQFCVKIELIKIINVILIWMKALGEAGH